MDLAVDTNVILACFKPHSVTRRLIAIEELHLSTTEYQFNEVNHYFRQVADKYAVDEVFIDETMEFLETRIDIHPKDEYINLVEKLKNNISDKDDLPLFALAIAKGFFIWTNDPHFQEQHLVKVYTTENLIEFIRQGKI